MENYLQQYTLVYLCNYILVSKLSVHCVCDSCRESCSVFPFSCVTRFPRSVKAVCDIGTLSSSSSSGVLVNPSSCVECISGDMDSSSSRGSGCSGMKICSSCSGSLFCSRQDWKQPCKRKECRNIRNIEYCVFSHNFWFSLGVFECTALIRSLHLGIVQINVKPGLIFQVTGLKTSL